MGKKSVLIALLLVIMVGTRFLSLPPNFSPLGAFALFGGAYISHKWLKYALPLLMIWVSDVFINNIIYTEYVDGFALFYQGSFINYLAFASIICVGAMIKKKSQLTVIIGATVSSVLFFVISNLGVWAFTEMYPNTMNGLVSCYTFALPFFKNTLVSTLLCSAVLFGIVEGATAYSTKVARS